MKKLIICLLLIVFISLLALAAIGLYMIIEGDFFMILKNKYLVNVVDFKGNEIYRKEFFDFNKAYDCYKLTERKYDEDEKSYVYKHIDLPNMSYANGRWFYQVGHDELEIIRSNLWGYSFDNEMFRISAQEYYAFENSSKGEYVKGNLQLKDKPGDVK